MSDRRWGTVFVKCFCFLLGKLNGFLMEIPGLPIIRAEAGPVLWFIDEEVGRVPEEPGLGVLVS